MIFLSRGGLYTPSCTFFQDLEDWENILRKLNRDYILRDKEPVEIIAGEVKKIMNPMMTKILLRRAKIHFFLRLKHLNDRAKVINNAIRAQALRKKSITPSSS